MEDLLNNIIFPLITSFVITYFSIPKIIHFSRKSRLYASVGDRDSHEGKIPIFGGVAIFSGILLSSNSTEISILDFLFFIFFEAYILNYYKYLLDYLLAFYLMMCHYFS